MAVFVLVEADLAVSTAREVVEDMFGLQAGLRWMVRAGLLGLALFV